MSIISWPFYEDAALSLQEIAAALTRLLQEPETSPQIPCCSLSMQKMKSTISDDLWLPAIDVPWS